jgi:ferrous iron transport protein B
MKNIKIAITGNPNCGKTTLFNILTGARQRVGNWPGVTVERITGEYICDSAKVEVTDLPGIYSFSAFSIDESIARRHILMGEADVVVNIVDATNLERNLYLTTQLLEMKVPVIVALNMVDMAKKQRIKVEVEHLARHLDCPVIPTVASRGVGIDELKNAILEIAESKAIPSTRVEYDSELEKAIERIRTESAEIAREKGVDARWLAIKLLERDELATEIAGLDGLCELVEPEAKRIEKHTGEDMDIVIADGRYGFIHGLALDVIHRDSDIRKTVSDSIDRITLNRALGIPIFLFIMYCVFTVTIVVGGPFIDFFDGLCGTIFVDGFGALLSTLHTPAWLQTLLADGIGGGIKTVSTFIPPIFLMFLCLSILEDSGYMARAAFIMDRFLRTVGLPGKAFIPMLVGFGCNVPGIMATRTLENSRDRVLTIMMNPFMSCGARLPVYALFAAAFFPRNGGMLIFGLYMTGILLAIMTGLLFKSTILKGETSTFVMELPPYHIPTFNGIMYHTWSRLKSFILRAGQIIMVVVIVLSFLSSMGTDGSFGNEDSEQSVLSAIGKSITPVFQPMGIQQDNWPATVGLFTGIFAKEAVVGTLDSLYSQMGGTEAESSSEKDFDFWSGIISAFRAIPNGFRGLLGGLADPIGIGQEPQASSYISTMIRHFDGKAGAVAYLLFILIYAPCVAALAAIYRETNLGWTIFSAAYLSFLAWVMATVFYQLATFVRHPGSSASWLLACAVMLVLFYQALKLKSRNLSAKA